MSSFIPWNLKETEAIIGCTFACICNTVFRMFSCLQINCQPFYLRQLLKFHQFDWLIEIYLYTEGQGTHHKMVSFQPMSGFSPLLGSSRVYTGFQTLLIQNFARFWMILLEFRSKFTKFWEKFLEFQSGSPSIYYRISNVVHGVCGYFPE